MELPTIIQGGMGVGVSNWRLARAVARCGQLGVVSGTAIDLILTRRLQDGDPGGEMRRALAAFPDQKIAADILDRYFIEGGKPADQAYAAKPMVGQNPDRRLKPLLVAANFVEVYLAKEGHDGQVGINYLHKILSPTLPSLYGAMLAGVDVVLMGAGIPAEIPAVLERLTKGQAVEIEIHATGESHPHWLRFDPAEIGLDPKPELKRPRFLPIVASTTLAMMLVKRCPGGIDGLIIEGPTAGGHNAPPRGAMKLNERGEPCYGPRDAVDPAAIAALGVPFWLAGAYGSPEKLAEARSLGAAGVQVGSVFAFCEESGLLGEFKQRVFEGCRTGDLKVLRDPLASPTGYPFQVLSAAGTLSESEVYETRQRRCDLGYLREPYEREDGRLAWRCPAEEPANYQAKGGAAEGHLGRKCLCNSLMANIGHGQLRGEQTEPALLTCGGDLSGVSRLLADHPDSYSAADVIDWLTG